MPMSMGILGNLHCLTILRIMNSYVGEEMTCHASSFPRLEWLWLDGLEKLREWRVEQGAMPLLSKLYIYNCLDLREWRVEQGAMPLLSKLQIDYCPGLKKVPDEVSSISADEKLNIIEENLSVYKTSNDEKAEVPSSSDEEDHLQTV
ncbi:hypothetical protein C2S51_021824 [Perilla frutescens var. frutescens]|nr:hypothetical protein C2S51_021824 [Perilla frutescens var. frutescens]